MKLQQLLLASKACQVHPGLSCPCSESHVLPARQRPRKGLALQQMMAAKRQHQAEQQHLNPLLLRHAGQTAAPAGSSHPQSSAGASPEASGEDLAVVNPLYSNTSGYSTSGSLFEGGCQPCVPFSKWHARRSRGHALSPLEFVVVCPSTSLTPARLARLTRQSPSSCTLARKYSISCAGQGSQTMPQHLPPAGGAPESSPWNPLYRDSPRTAISPQALTMDKWLVRPQDHGRSAEQPPGGYSVCKDLFMKTAEIQASCMQPRRAAFWGLLTVTRAPKVDHSCNQGTQSLPGKLMSGTPMRGLLSRGCSSGGEPHAGHNTRSTPAAAASDRACWIPAEPARRATGCARAASAGEGGFSMAGADPALGGSGGPAPAHLGPRTSC